MKSMRRALIVGLGLGLASGPAAAEDLYVELQVGSSSFQEADIDVTGLGSGTLEYEPGFTVGGALGMRAFEGLMRFEGSVSYRQSEIEGLDTGSVNLSGGDNTLGVTALLANAYVDIPVSFPVKPYVGGGIGAAIYTPEVDDGGIEINNQDVKLAGNLMAGAFYPVLENVELDLRYRWLAADDAELDAEVRGSAAQNRLQAEFRAHEVVVALRLLF